MARPIAKDHDLKRGAILKTAARTFADEGFDRASMAGLARACGISKSLIYHYYASKEALLFDILHTHLSALKEAVDGVEGGADPEADLRAVVHVILEAYRNADAEHKLQLDALGVLPAAERRTLEALQRDLVTLVSDALTRTAAPLFEARPEALRPAAMSLFGMLNWVYMWHRPKGGISRAEYADMATDLMLGGMERLARKAENNATIAR